jgi:hypothetical protein
MADLNFDDLIPANKGSAGVSFDDLIPKAKPKRSLMQNATGFMANVNRGLGIGDELAGAVGSGVNMLAGRQVFAPQRQLEDQYAQEHPSASALARGTGSAATAANAFAQAPRAVNAVRGAVTSGLVGAGYAAADRGTLGERVQAASDAANPLKNPVGFTLGALGGALAPAARRTPKPKPPSVEQLKAQRTKAYGDVEASGHRYEPEAFKGLVSNIQKDMGSARFDPDFHPTAAKMLDKIQKRAEQGWAPSLSELDDLRKFVNENVTSSSNRTERMFGRKMVDQIDTFIEGQGGEASGLIGKARGLHSRYRKVEGLTEAVEKGQRAAAKSGSGGNVDNAIRQKVSTFLDKTPNLSAEERAAVERIVYGTKGQNALRQVGKLSPQGNGLMLAGHLMAGFQTGGLSTLAAGVGAGAKHVADATTKRNVAEAIRIMAMDRPSSQEVQAARRALSALPQSDLGVRALQRELAARLSVAGGASAQPNASPAR